MEFYIPNLPMAASERQIRGALAEAFRSYYIYVFDIHLWVPRNGRNNFRNARITMHDPVVGEEILRSYGDPPPSTTTVNGRMTTRHRHAARSITVSGSRISLLRGNGRYPIAPQVIRALREENERKARSIMKSQPASHKPYREPIPFTALECGVWITNPKNPSLPTFSSFYTCESGGNFRLTRAAIQVHIAEGRRYILSNSVAIRSIAVTYDNNESYFVVSMKYCPKFYRQASPTNGSYSGHNSTRNPRSRVPFLDDLHKKVAPYCYVYRFKLRNARDSIRITTIGSLRGFIEAVEIRAFYQKSPYDFQYSMKGLEEQLRLRPLPFPVSFQLQTLAYNGLLLPHRVKEILNVVRDALASPREGVSQIDNENIIAAILKFWVDKRQPQLHSDDPASWLQEGLISELRGTIQRLYHSNEVRMQLKFQTMGNHALVHRVIISPSSIYLQGPSPEPKNRVLRKFASNINYFVRVTITDEGGRDLRFERGVDGKTLFSERFLPFFMQDSQDLRIAGQNFTFLGFSQSSLRSHAAWFIAPFSQRENHTLKEWTVDAIIKDLGDFGDIKIPGKCAARIGQAFTDTIANIRIEQQGWAILQDVEKNVGGLSYNFSDGCGIISEKTWRRILAQLRKDNGDLYMRRFKPSVFQIRLAGFKGVVSVDTNPKRRDLTIGLRTSMRKFHSRGHDVFEICLSVIRPSPLYLNRGLVKILEDRGVPIQTFLDIQEDALLDLRQTTEHPDKTAHWLESQGRCKAADIPFLIRELAQLTHNYKEDHFLRQVVEYSMLSTLRDLKYKARIPIRTGFTLIGILDETGFLREGEIYCPIKEEDTPRYPIIGDMVAIARSPALHPGDVQVVKAVDVPYNSPLQVLTNCVVFSRHGDRDLPSMLAGGDLDGDQYHIWWDQRLIPSKPASPAAYEKVAAVPLDREVTQADIGQFFLDFMENDRLGAIATTHMVLADSLPGGTYNPKCLRCAELASTAVDFPKTGIPVKMSDLPKTPNVRPDFLAPGPKIKIFNNHLNIIENDDEDSDNDSDPNPHTTTDADDPFATSRQYLYYKSDKALGYLFRDVDEQKFVKDWETAARRFEQNRPNNLIMRVCKYLLSQVNLSTVLRWNGFAANLRVSYEYRMHDFARDYATRRDEPLEEVEVFIGCILGTESHRQTRFQRDASENLKQDVHRLITHTMSRIRHGSDEYTIEEGSYDGSTLERAVMCVMDSYTARDDGVEGKSFGWLAAAVALREIAKRGLKQATEDAVQDIASRIEALSFPILHHPLARR